MPIAALAALVPAAIQMFQSIKQGNQANKFASQYGRPNMQIPSGMLDALEIKKDLAYQNRLPGEEIIRESIREGGANTMADIKEAATSPWQVIAGAQGVGENISEKNKQLGIAGAEYGVQAKDELSKALERLAEWEQEKYIMEDYYPYMNAMKTVSSLRDASTKNLYSGASNIAGVLANNPDMFSQIFGNNGAGKAMNRLESNANITQQSLKYNPANFASSIIE